MRRLLILAVPVVTAVLIFSCGSKKNPSANQPVQPDLQKKPAETIFGVYNFGKSGKIAIVLEKDSTAVMKNSGTTSNPYAPHEGTFTFRNDSIFITWDNGRLVKCRFEKTDTSYSFRIGSTTYKRKL